MTTRFSIGVTCLLWLIQGCTTQPVFPVDSAKAVSIEQFRSLQAEADRERGRLIKLAGKIVQAENKDSGVLILAEWIPFPKSLERGPVEFEGDRAPRFLLRYPGHLKQAAEWRGNKFVAVGTSEGTATPEGLTSEGGETGPVPYVVAHCLHVWETGEESIDEKLDQFFEVFPILEETFCIGQ